MLIYYFIFANIVSQDYLLIRHSDFTPATKLIMQHEGYRSTPYIDSDGKLTIGYGFKLKMRYKRFMSEKIAKSKILQDLRYRLKRLRHLITVPVNNNQANALLSLVYNIGLGSFARSDMLRKLNSGNYDLKSEFMRWKYVKGKITNGLIKRRKAEWGLYEKVHIIFWRNRKYSYVCAIW